MLSQPTDFFSDEWRDKTDESFIFSRRAFVSRPAGDFRFACERAGAKVAWH
jgi:hypothetical protein